MIHARSGVPHEIMGLMQGKVVGNSIVIMDSFALPVQGTETRVNAASEANEYMVEYIQGSEKVCTVPHPFNPSFAFEKFALLLILPYFRQGDWRTLSGGTTRILDTDVGFPVSM